MTTDEFECDLREALARCAEEVPAEIGERLRQHNYHPRGIRPLVAGVSVALVALGAGAAALSVGTSSTVTPRATPRATNHASPLTKPTSPLTGGKISLADTTIRLPAGFEPTYRPCAPMPSGLVAPVTGSNLSAAASSSTGGCIDVLLAGTASQPPAGSVPVTVGGYQGSLFTDQTTGVTTLYMTITAANLDLIFTAEGLTATELESTAAAPMPNLARQLVGLVGAA
jgi:hypothetical protein